MSAAVVFSGELFAWDDDGGWHFIRLPHEASDEVRDSWLGPPRGFGSVKVEAKIGTTTWSTSLFPEKSSGSYLLPVKKPVRTAEGLLAGDVVVVEVVVVEGDEGA